jgi:Domain of unknown function (DUF4276)
MARLLVHVEGQTEESFVRNLLAPRLLPHGYDSVAARLMGNARQRDKRGGVQTWPALRNEVVRHLREDRSAIATLMVDYYAMPVSWPGRNAAASAPHPDKAALVQDAIAQDVQSSMGRGFNARRFVPFVLLHEYESLLFSDCVAFATGVGEPDLAPEFQKIVTQCGSPEEINDSPITAPSKRIIQLMPGYSKVLLGTLAALEIGIAQMEQKCPNFGLWIERLIASVRPG